jgi:oxygen-dependent protoporphyrinogen oxidase
MKRVAVIGAGIAGLSASYSLEKKAKDAGIELNIDLIEKQGRTGGNIVTEKADDLVIEGGPDCVFSEKPAALKLCEELGLENQLLKTNEDKKGTFIYWKEELHDLPEGVMLMVPTMIKPMLFSSLITLTGKLRIGIELLIPQKTDLTDETLAQFVTRRFGRELLDKIAEPLVAGIHAGHPETMSIRSSFPRFVALEEKYRSLIKGMLIRKKEMAAITRGRKPKYTMFMTIKDGLQVLPDTIRNSLKATALKLDVEVASLSRNTDGLVLNTDRGLLRPYDSVVIATPSYVASKIVNDVSPELASQLDEIPYVSTATVSLAYSTSNIDQSLNGFGFLVPKISKRRIMAATYTSNKFSYRAPEGKFLIRVFVGGASNESLVFQEDKKIIKMVREELEDILGIRAEPLFAKVYKWEKAMPQYTVGHLDRLSHIEETASKLPGLYLAGSAYKGIGISDCIVSADNVANEVVKFLKAQSTTSSS